MKMSETMIQAVKECIEEGREVTYLGTLLSATTRLAYHWDNLTKELISTIKEDVSKLCK